MTILNQVFKSRTEIYSIQTCLAKIVFKNYIHIGSKFKVNDLK